MLNAEKVIQRLKSHGIYATMIMVEGSAICKHNAVYRRKVKSGEETKWEEELGKDTVLNGDNYGVISAEARVYGR